MSQPDMAKFSVVSATRTAPTKGGAATLLTMSHAFPAGSARALARALGSRVPAGSSPGPRRARALPAHYSPPFPPNPEGLPGDRRWLGRVVRRGENRGILFGIFPSCRVFSRVTHMIWGVCQPCPPGEGSGPRVWSGQGVWGADLLLIVVLGGSFLPGEGSLLSQLTFFSLPVFSARGRDPGLFYIFDPPTRTPLDAPPEIFQDFSFFSDFPPKFPCFCSPES